MEGMIYFPQLGHFYIAQVRRCHVATTYKNIALTKLPEFDKIGVVKYPNLK